MKTTPSSDCIYCGRPHGKMQPMYYQACEACESDRDQRMVDASTGLVTASCPRCDLLFSVEARPTLTAEEREAIEDAAGICEEHAEEYDGAVSSPIAATLRNLLERTK